MLSLPLSSFIPYVLLMLSSETVVPKQEGPSPSTGHTHTDTHLPFSLLPGPGNFWVLNGVVKWIRSERKVQMLV